MLGERRSKAAFSAGFPEAVREETRQDSGHLTEEIMETEASLDGLDGGEGIEENFQNDSLSEQACEGQMHGKEDIWSEEEDIEAPLCTQKTGGRSLRTHDLFFASEDEGRDFQSVLQEIQAYLSKEYSNLVTGDGNEEIKAQIRRFAGKYIQDNRIQVPGKTTDELIDAIYSEMAEFGFLTKYIYGEGIEEMDHSYVALCGVAEHALMQLLNDAPHISQIALCLDHDKAGIQARERIKKNLSERGYHMVFSLFSNLKDWNEDLQELKKPPPEYMNRQQTVIQMM